MAMRAHRVFIIIVASVAELIVIFMPDPDKILDSLCPDVKA